jgi:hypothetical protein
LALGFERRMDEADRDVRLAWQIAAFTRGTKGLPKVERFYVRRPGGRKPAGGHRDMVEMLGGKYGGRLRSVSLKSVRHKLAVPQER